MVQDRNAFIERKAKALSPSWDNYYICQETKLPTFVCWGVK